MDTEGIVPKFVKKILAVWMALKVANPTMNKIGLHLSNLNYFAINLNYT